MSDPLSLPPLQLSDDTTQWLVDQQLVTPEPLGLFASRSPQEVKSVRGVPKELGVLSLNGIATNKHAPLYRRALEIVAAPTEKVSVLTRRAEEEELAFFYVRDDQATLAVQQPDHLSIAPCFALSLLSSNLAKKLTSAESAVIALLPELLSLFSKQFISDERKVVGRSARDLRAAFTEQGYSTFTEEGLLREEAGQVRPAPTTNGRSRPFGRATRWWSRRAPAPSKPIHARFRSSGPLVTAFGPTTRSSPRRAGARYQSIAD